MNFNNLIAKIAELDKPINKSSILDECPECEAQAEMNKPEQLDSITASLNINGSGAGGIRDMMDILRNIENSNDSGDEFNHDIEEPLMSDGYENSIKNDKGGKVFDQDAIIFTGDDLASNTTDEPKKVQGGGNPYSESLFKDLTALYEDIKARPMREAIGRGDEVEPPDNEPQKPKYNKIHHQHSSYEYGPEDYDRERRYASRDAAQEYKRNSSKSKWIDKEGIAPNGKEYNTVLIITAVDESAAKQDLEGQMHFHRGPKMKFVDVDISKNDDGKTQLIAFVNDDKNFKPLNFMASRMGSKTDDKI